MPITYTNTESGKKYHVQGEAEFVELIKNSSPHTKDMSTEEYIKQQCGVMESMWEVKGCSDNPSAQKLVQAWIEKGIFTIENKQQQSRAVV